MKKFHINQKKKKPSSGAHSKETGTPATPVSLSPHPRYGKHLSLVKELEPIIRRRRKEKKKKKKRGRRVG